MLVGIERKEFAAGIKELPIAGFSDAGIDRLWKWYSEEVKHWVIFNPETVACDWAEYECARDAIRDLNDGYIKDLVRKENGDRLNEMDMRVFSEKYLRNLLGRKMHYIEVPENGNILVDLSDSGEFMIC